MPVLRIHQIWPPQVSRADLDAGFEVLDNTRNERPDWFEYWPIRAFLLGQPLDEDVYYGFLSPKFRSKTNLDAAALRDFVERSAAAPDVFLFSPSIHNSAFYWNVFEHGDAEHPGLKALAVRLFERLGLPSDLDTLVTDSRNTVHSNYFIARPRFWRAWLEVNERLFAIAEDPADALGAELRAPTRYRGETGVHMKIFIMERIATWLLAANRGFSAAARDPFAARSRVYKLPLAVACDALKIAHAETGRAQYRDVFRFVTGLKGVLNAQVRIGAALGLRAATSTLARLRAYWHGGRR